MEPTSLFSFSSAMDSGHGVKCWDVDAERGWCVDDDVPLEFACHGIPDANCEQPSSFFGGAARWSDRRHS